MKKMLTATIIILSNISVSSFADPLGGVDTAYSALSYMRPDFVSRDSSKIIQAHYRPRFLGCVYSYHECEHLGHDRGFFNHSISHNHRICHHGPSYACYGR